MVGAESCLPIGDTRLLGPASVPLRVTCQYHPWNPLQVGHAPHVVPVAQHFTHSRLLRVTYFQRQRAPRTKHLARLRRQTADHIHSVSACEHRASRFELADLELHLVVLRLADIWWIRGHDIECSLNSV